MKKVRATKHYKYLHRRTKNARSNLEVKSKYSPTLKKKKKTK